MRFFISLRFIRNDSNTELKKNNTSLSLPNPITLKRLPLNPSKSQTHHSPTQHHLNSLPLHHGITTNLSKAADSGHESDAEICL